ncbi:MAG: restriction endonuclease subunit S [Lancefieldella parvula]|uniref:Restriction endonuclease subunit S n=1 Tax=Lancefieldella parvula TaxID=1382 RepID=A0A9E7AC81_9ACTN|nr:MAG: restriction endonuclease subunit S [Lancefieldella parvula]
MKYGKSNLKQITVIRTGKLDSNAAVLNGIYPFFTCDPTTLRINTWAYDTEAVLLAGNNASGNYTAKYYKGQFNAYQRTYIIESADKEKLDVRYLAYAMNKELKLLKTMSAGSTTKFLKIGMLHGLEISFPDISIQRKIASILGNYDDLIENNKKQIKLLEEAAQRLYKEWFVDLCFPGYEDVEIVDGVPEGWNKELIGNVIGKVSRTKQIKTADYLLEGSIPIIDQSRDFIAGYTNDSEALVNIGTPVIVFGDHTRILKYIQFPFAKGADGTQLIISDRTNMPQSLLYLSLIAVDLSNYHYARHFKYLKAESILIPSQDVADEFDRLISPFFSQIQKLREKCYKLIQARDHLLPKLMSGEIEV